MPRRRLAALGLLLLPASLLGAPTRARADDEPAPPPRSDKPEKPKVDDTSIFKDWSLCKGRGAKHNRERAQLWTERGTSGKDLMWLARMWQRGEDFPKAAAAFEQFLEYKPPPGDEKAVANNLTNRETARGALIEVYFQAREYEKSIAAAARFREEFDASVVANDTYTDEGRAERMLGHDEKALTAFEKAAPKQFRALSDIVDVHLAAGEVDKAKAAVERFGPGLDKQVDKVRWLTELLAAVGSPAPSPDVLVSVGPTGTTPLTSYDKATVLTYWSVQSANIDRKLATLEVLRKDLDGRINVVAVATWKKFNLETNKIEEGITPEQEAAAITKLIDQSGERLPPCALAPQAFLDAAKLKWDAQLTIVDAQGNLRWARINESKPYDLAALKLAAERISAAK